MDDVTPTGSGTLSAVLAVFEETAPGEPLTAVEVSEAVGCSRRTAYNRLRRLESRGELDTKKVGAHARVWWRNHDARTGEEAAPDASPAEDSDGRIVELEFSSERLARGFAAAAPSVRQFSFTVAQELPLPDGRQLQYYTVTGIPPRAYIEVVEAFPSVESIRLMSTVGDVNRIETLGTRDSVTEVIKQHVGRITRGGLRDGAYWLVAELPSATDTDAVAQAVREVYPDMTLVSTRYVPTVRDFWTVVADELTERQRTVLQLAYYAGYFEEPRSSTGTELADRLGITRQTLNHHLRQAENTVFGRLFEGDSRAASDW